MEKTSFTAAGAKRFYAVQLNQLKKLDQADQNPSKGLVEQDDLKAAYIESGDSFAFVSRSDEELSYGVYTPNGAVQAGSFKSNGDAWIERNLRSGGISSGRHEDYEVVEGYKPETERTQEFAARKKEQFSALLDNAFLSGQLSDKLLM